MDNSLEPYQIPAKPTIYKGTCFDSALEVTVARALDTIGLPWSYEPSRYADNSGYYTPDFLVTLPVVGVGEWGGIGSKDADVYIDAKYTLQNETIRRQAIRRAQILEQSTDDPLIFVGLQELHASLAGWILSGDGTAIPGAITRRRKHTLAGPGDPIEPCLYIGPMAEAWLDGFGACFDKLVLPTYRDWA